MLKFPTKKQWTRTVIAYFLMKTQYPFSKPVWRNPYQLWRLKKTDYWQLFLFKTLGLGYKRVHCLLGATLITFPASLPMILCNFKRAFHKNKHATHWTQTRFSQRPSLLISGSERWPGALALSFAFAAENIKNLPLALRAREKIWARLLASLNADVQMYLNVSKKDFGL